jgi:predicted RNA methylase
MKYQVNDTIIPQDQRADINEKILALINSTDMQGITSQDIFDAYTGVGGLHGLNKGDYNSFSEYTEAKKEIEQGQFFTPGNVIEQIARLLRPASSEFICDLTCGAGAFFNHFQGTNCYGCEIDINAFTVAKHLYPLANLQCMDIKYYRPAIRFDYIVGNPPFNLTWKVDGIEIKSQQYFCRKADELLKPGDLLMAIVPESFLADEFFNKSAIADLDNRFNFIFQYRLPANAFASMGVTSFATKVICFQKRSEHLEHTPYSNTFSTSDHAMTILNNVHQDRQILKAKLLSEYKTSISSDFQYRVNKYLYEIKTHKALKEHYGKAYELAERFKTQVCPTEMKYSEWEKVKLTETKVIGSLRRIIKKQNQKQVNKIELVKTQYGFRLKPYSDKAKHRLNKKVTHVSFNDLVTGQGSWDLISGNQSFWKLALKKKHSYELHTKQFLEMGRDQGIDAWLKRFTFISPKDKCAYEFNDMQFNDLGIILQKNYGILNWQQGCGKTAASFAWAQYKKQRNTFIIGPALAVNLTWVTFMEVNGISYVNLQKYKDLRKIKPGDYILASLDFVIKFERQIKRYMKLIGHKANLIFDESDEITNAASKRTKAVNSCFRRAKRKLLATGTTTRNNITELYSQLELIYNNSINMICLCEKYFVEEFVKVKDAIGQEAGTKLREHSNKYYMQPFPPYFGPTLFKRCFNPSKSSVFGIAKHNQDIYNENALRDLIGQSIITRKFKELAGDKYTIHNMKVQQTMAERFVYRKIISELHEVIPEFFESTGSSKKDSMLRIIRQLNLLIQATSMPQNFKDYHGDRTPSKAKGIIKWVDDRNEKVAIGCTSIDAVEWYEAILAAQFPNREVFKVVGEINFRSRKNIIKEFEATPNGILICTQQSLKSSVNIPSCNEVMIESLQWNIPKMEQFFFRFIRYDSADHTNVTFINYDGTIEMNLLALLMTKEKLNDYIKTLEYRQDSDIYDEYGIDTDILSSILTKEKDEEGHVHINWGQAQLV